MPYEKVVLSEALGANNELGKPATFLGIMKNSPEGLSIWTDNRREIVLAFGKNDADGPFYIGEVRKKDAHYVWVWAIPISDIRGYDDLVKEIKKSKEASQ